MFDKGRIEEDSSYRETSMSLEITCQIDDLKEMRLEARTKKLVWLESGDLVICEGGEPGRAAVWNGQSETARIRRLFIVFVSGHR